MKKMNRFLFLVIGLLVLVTGQAMATQSEGTVGANAKREIPGALGYVPYKEIQLVRYAENKDAAGNDLSAGDVVVWDCVSDDGVTIALVGGTNSADAVAGVVVSTHIQTADSTGTTPGIDYGRRNWGWIQVRGFNTNVNMVGTAPGAGGAIKASDTARNAERINITSNGGEARIMGFAYDASTDPEVGLDL